MLKSDRLVVAEGIIDSAVSEFRKANLAGIESVLDYAENGCGITLTQREAEQVLEVCGRVDAKQSTGEILSTDDWYYGFELLLSSTRGEIIASEIMAAQRKGVQFVTYGDGDLGVPVAIDEAIKDFEAMEDQQIGAGTWYPCDEAGTIQ